MPMSGVHKSINKDVRDAMINIPKNVAVICLLHFILINSVLAGAPKLEFFASATPIKSYTLDELKNELTVQSIKFHHYNYSKTKKYRAFLIQDVLRLAYGEAWDNDLEADVVFTALDGYKAVAKISTLKEIGGYLAFADLDVVTWEPVGRSQANPGPFYLVWTGKQQTPQHEYPWPWQLAAINLLRFKDQYPAVYPQGVPEDSTIYSGFEIYKGRCFRCHAINQQGGKIGPDLNAPQSIVTYRSKHIIKEFIKQPSKYRYTKMPDHLDLSESDLDALLDYFWHQSQNN